MPGSPSSPDGSGAPIVGTLHGVELVTAALRLRGPVHTAAGTHDQRPVLYVRVVGDGLEGWGECAAMADGTLVDPPLDVVHRALRDTVLPRLWSDAAQTRPVARAPAEAAFRMASAALEMALLDAELRQAQRSLADWLGATRETVEVGGVVGAAADGSARPVDNIGALVAAAEALVERGVRRLRVKIRPGWDRQPLDALRSRFPDLALQADANGAYRWTPETARRANAPDASRLRQLDDLGLVCIEQPLPPDDLAASAALANEIATPICLDESITDLERLDRAIRLGACRVACIKGGRLGGLRAAQAALHRCGRAGIPAFVGGFFETGLGRTAAIALAALEESSLPGDLTPATWYLDVDPCSSPVPVDGLLTPPRAPGVGPHPDLGALPPGTDVRREWLPAPMGSDGKRPAPGGRTRRPSVHDA